MKNIIVIIITLSFNINLSAALLKGVSLTVINNSKSAIEFVSDSGDGTSYNSAGKGSIFGKNERRTFRYKPSVDHVCIFCTGAVDKVLTFIPKSKTNGIINISLSNPFVGSSRYSAEASSPWNAKVTYINTDGNSDYQLVEVEITDGVDSEGCNGIKFNTTSLTSETISGLISFNKKLIKPKTTNLNSLFTMNTTCPSIFKPCTFGLNKFENSTGFFEGKANVGNLVITPFSEQGDNIIYKYEIAKLPFEVPLIFDIECNLDNWINAEENKQPDYKKRIFILCNSTENTYNITIKKGSIYNVNFNIDAYWVNEDANTENLGQQLAEKIMRKKEIRTNPMIINIQDKSKIRILDKNKINKKLRINNQIK